MINLYPSKFATNKNYKVPEATEILAHWGIAKTEKKTRDLISKGKLKAEKAGDNPDDRRSGYLITEKAIYELITSEIPAAKEAIEIINEKKASKTPKTKQTKTVVKEEVNEK